MKLLIDMNLSPLWVKFFADHDIHSVHWAKIGKASDPDLDILDYAAANGFVIFTHDLDFGALLAKHKSAQPSVIQIRSQNILPIAIGDIVLRALRASRTQLEAGALVTVEPQRDRIRLLPLSS